jgi:NAD(P)-dependent dehydrogenase (short-subunit alcohol dehydrogenase family)
MPSYPIDGKTVLITGAARGIGAETARRLASKGARVSLVGLEPEELENVAAQCGPQAAWFETDVTDWDALERAVSGTVERFGGIDVVVANAGIASRVATFRAMSPESFERVLDVNLMGVYRTVEAALPEIVRRRGHVVVISSIYAFTNGAGAVPYAMSKAAVEQFGRALRAELAQHGASASVAYFGFIDTEMVHRAIDSDPLADRMLQTLPRPLRKRVPPSVAGEAIAQAVQRRRPRIIRPRRWIVMSLLRGLLNPLSDARLERDEQTQGLLRAFDARAGEDQPTTA